MRDFAQNSRLFLYNKPRVVDRGERFGEHGALRRLRSARFGPAFGAQGHRQHGHLYYGAAVRRGGLLHDGPRVGPVEEPRVLGLD